jgi:hypothetical protein
LAGLFTRFSQNLLADEGSRFTQLGSEADLEGLPESLRAGYATDAESRGLKGRWVIANTRSSVEPFLTYSTRRDLREKVWREFVDRGDNGDARDNNAIIGEILQLRAERARLLGHPTHAHWRLENTMARTPERAMALMEAVWKPAVARVREEVADMQRVADAEGDKLTLVATDGRRLALAEINDLEIPPSQEREFIVRTKAIHELMRALKDDGEVVIRLAQNLVQFDCGPTTLISKLVEGNYPNYVQVIPTKVNERVTVERESLLNAVRRVSLLNNEKTASVRLSFAKGNIDITSNTPEVGEARETLPVSYKGKDISISFNPEFLMAPLRYLQEDEVHFELIDDISPGVIKINAPFVYVLMPMRVGGA